MWHAMPARACLCSKAGAGMPSATRSDGYMLAEVVCFCYGCYVFAGRLSPQDTKNKTTADSDHTTCTVSTALTSRGNQGAEATPDLFYQRFKCILNNMHRACRNDMTISSTIPNVGTFRLPPFPVPVIC
jgi:hypothetical protein